MSSDEVALSLHWTEECRLSKALHGGGVTCSIHYTYNFLSWVAWMNTPTKRWNVIHIPYIRSSDTGYLEYSSPITCLFGLLYKPSSTAFSRSFRKSRRTLNPVQHVMLNHERSSEIPVIFPLTISCCLHLMHLLVPRAPNSMMQICDADMLLLGFREKALNRIIKNQK